MVDERLQDRADGLAARVEALAAALHASGIPEETAARVVGRASAAVLQALTLELLLDRREPPAAGALRLTTGQRHRPELGVRLAA
jgi:hypothetical protein